MADAGRSDAESIPYLCLCAMEIIQVWRRWLTQNRAYPRLHLPDHLELPWLSMFVLKGKLSCA
jgi:hypothetical protein